MDEILDSRRPGWRQIVIALLCLLVLAIDGLDYQMLAYVAPMVIDDFGISKAELGTAISAALIGMAAGAITGGAIGDRIGRKPAIVFTALFFGLTTIATGFAAIRWRMSTAHTAANTPTAASAATGPQARMDTVAFSPCTHNTARSTSAPASLQNFQHPRLSPSPRV